MHRDLVVDDLDAGETAELKFGATRHEHLPDTTLWSFSTRPGTRSACLFCLSTDSVGYVATGCSSITASLNWAACHLAASCALPCAIRK